MPPAIIYLSRPLSNNLDEGSKNLVYYLAQHIQHRISVFTTSDFHLSLPPHIKKIKLPVSSASKIVDESKGLKVKLMLFTALWRSEKRSIVHSFYTLSPLNAFALLIITKLKAFTIVLNIPAFKIKHQNNIFINMLLKKTFRINVLTNYTKKLLEKYSFKVFIIPPYIDPQRFHERSSKDIQEIKSEMKITSPFIVIYPGEYGRVNANEAIVQIIQEVQLNSPDILFILACRLKHKRDKAIENNIKSKLASNNVLFLNTVDQFGNLLAISDLCLFPIHMLSGEKVELPLVLLESITSNIPIMISNTKPLDEIFIGKDGLIVNTINEYVSLINKMYDDSAYHQKHRNLSKELKEHYTSLTIIKKYDNMYNKIINQSEIYG